MVITYVFIGMFLGAAIDAAFVLSEHYSSKALQKVLDL